MLLRSISKHVKDQNWFAIGIDFFIVVVGILIAFQISSMAEKRSERTTFERKMQALKIEMTENLARYETTIEKVEHQFAAITQLRSLLGDPAIEASASQIDALFFQSVGVFGVYTKRNSLDAALTSDLYTEINSPALIDAIEQWEEQLSQLSRVQQDALRYRDNQMHTYFTEHLAYASVLATWGLADGKIAPSKFEKSRQELSEDHVLDNILTGRQVSTLQDITYTRELVAHARRIIQLIDDQGDAP